MARVILIISSSIGAIGMEIMNLNLNNPFCSESLFVIFYPNLNGPTLKLSMTGSSNSSFWLHFIN